jgi:hypothetical protein
VGANNGDPNASAYFAYEIDLGQNRVSDQSAGSAGVPELSFDTTSPGGGLPASSTLPIGSFIVGYLLGTSHGDIATANSESLLIDERAVIPTPETLLAAGLAGLGMVLRRHQAAGGRRRDVLRPARSRRSAA